MKSAAISSLWVRIMLKSLFNALIFSFALFTLMIAKSSADDLNQEENIPQISDIQQPADTSQQKSDVVNDDQNLNDVTPPAPVSPHIIETIDNNTDNNTNAITSDAHIINIDPPVHSNNPIYYFKKVEPLAYVNFTKVTATHHTIMGFNIVSPDSHSNEESVEIQKLRDFAQRNIQEIVNLNMNEGLRAYLKGFPIQLTLDSNNESQYDLTANAVILASDSTDVSDNSTVLRALLQAYYVSITNGSTTGFNDRLKKDIELHFNRAQHNLCTAPPISAQRPCYDPSSDMVRDSEHFFARTAAIWLTGDSAQEPFTAHKLKKLDPKYAVLLSRLLKASSSQRVSALTSPQSLR